MPRTDETPRVLVERALQFIEVVEERLAGHDADSLSADPMRLESVQMRMLSIAEDVRKLPRHVANEMFTAFTQRDRLYSIANQLRHGYTTVTAERVLEAARTSMAVLKDALRKLAKSPVLDEPTPTPPRRGAHR